MQKQSQIKFCGCFLFLANLKNIFIENIRIGGQPIWIN